MTIAIVFSPRRAPHGHLVSAVNPDLNADHAERRMGFSKTVVYIRAQRVKRQPSLQIPLGARDLRPVQTSRHSYLDSLSPEALGIFDGPPHRSPESDSLLQLLSDLLGLKLRVEFGLVNLLNVYIDLAAGSLFDLALELIDLRPFTADDDAGSRGVDDDL